MAINKKKASPGIRIGIIVVAGLLVLSFIPWGGLGVFSNSGSQGGSGTQGELDAIASKYAPRVSGLERMLASEPTSYTVLVQIGHAYSGWGGEVQSSSAGAIEADRPLWLSAVVFYDRALAVNATIPPDLTDAAIARFYSGDTAGAIERIESVWEIDPDFAPAYFNAGIFYESAGRLSDAIASFERYLELDPEGQGPGDPDFARTALTRLGEATGTVEATVTP